MYIQLLLLLEQLKTSKLVFAIVYWATFKYQNAETTNISLYLIIIE